MHNLLWPISTSKPRKRRREGDGGELVLLPFLGAEPKVIPPLMDRMVVFRCVCFVLCYLFLGWAGGDRSASLFDHCCLRAYVFVFRVGWTEVDPRR